MMLNPKVERSFIGLNFISLICALSSKGSTLVLDDYRVRMSQNMLRFNELEKALLQTWGLVLNIKPLLSINEFLRPSCVQFILGSKRVLLGGPPTENVRELCRKFPDAFAGTLEYFNEHSGEDFDQFFFDEMEGLGDSCFRFKNLHTIDSKVFEQLAHPLYQNLIEDFKNIFLNKREDKLHEFAVLFKSFYHFEICHELDEFEINYLLINLISPLYELDHQMVSEVLQDEYIKKGYVKRAQIQSWQTYEKRLEHFELNSFEGVISPVNSFFMGELNYHYPFKTSYDYQFFKTQKVKVRFEQSLFAKDFDQVVYSLPQELYSAFPFLILKPLSSKEALISIPYYQFKGNKGEFYKDHFLKMISHFLDVYFPFETLDFDYEFQETVEILRSREFKPFQKNRNDNSSGLSLMKSDSPIESESIQGIEYWGSLRNHSLGNFSYLMDLKDRFE